MWLQQAGDLVECRVSEEAQRTQSTTPYIQPHLHLHYSTLLHNRVEHPVSPIRTVPNPLSTTDHQSDTIYIFIVSQPLLSTVNAPAVT